MYNIISLVISILSTTIAAFTLIWEIYQDKISNKSKVNKEIYFQRITFNVKNDLINTVQNNNSDKNIWSIGLIAISFGVFNWNKIVYLLILFIQYILYACNSFKYLKNKKMRIEYFLIYISFAFSFLLIVILASTNNILNLFELLIVMVSTIWYILFNISLSQEVFSKLINKPYCITQNYVKNELLISISACFITVLIFTFI